MEDIRNALMRGDGDKLSKKEYKMAVQLETKRLQQQLCFLIFVSALIAIILFISLYFDIKDATVVADDTTDSNL